MLSASAIAQDEAGKVYCELRGTGKFMSSKVIVTVDFGQETNIWTSSSKQYLVDERGKAKSFNSMVDAMNFMGRLGWNFEQAYIVTSGSQNVYHWLLSKSIANEEEIRDGITTKEEYQERQKGQR